MKKIIGSFVMTLILVNFSNGQCPQRDSSNAPAFIFMGYTYEEVANTIVKDLQNNVVVDSFLIITDGHYDSLRLQYEGDFPFREMKLNHIYQFCIPGYQPYELSNMKIVYKQVYQGHLCLIGQYDLNGVTHHDFNPVFIKDGAMDIIRKNLRIKSTVPVHQ